MPSIFNHESNACWGIRRSTCNIFNEQLSLDSAEDEKMEYSACVNPNNKVGNFHGSSNGYYGYHIPSTAPVSEIDMDTSSAVSTVNDCQQNGLIAGSDQNQNSIESWSRKRCHSIEQNASKRIKKDGSELANEIAPTEIQPSSESSTNNSNNDLPVYSSIYRCTMSHYM